MKYTLELTTLTQTFNYNRWNEFTNILQIILNKMRFFHL